MREHPILFTSDMVRAILAGRKTQTRRLCLQARDHVGDWARAVHPARETGWIAWWGIADAGLDKFTKEIYRNGFPCPYGMPGDRLWVRETTRKHCHGDYPGGTYEADLTAVIGDKAHQCFGRANWWYSRDVCPSIHMPRWASRILLEITAVRVERLQDISWDDVGAEGIGRYTFAKGCLSETRPDPRWAFIELWDSLNAKRGCSWEVNSWVWVIEFRRLPHA